MRRKTSKEKIEDRQRLLTLARLKLENLDRKQLRKFLSAYQISGVEKQNAAGEIQEVKT